jgi:hypothetical protein
MIVFDNKKNREQPATAGCGVYGLFFLGGDNQSVF